MPSSYHPQVSPSSSPSGQPTPASDFTWDILACLVEGQSPIDLQALTVDDRAQAHQFLYNYGYDLNDSQDRETVEDLFAEALRFIKLHFSRGHSSCPTYLTIPAEIERLNDVRDLLVWASGPRTTERQAWSCAILRVMHTIHHLDNTMRAEFFPEIKRQILDKFRQNISTTSAGVVLGTGEEQISLYGVFYKEEKSRDSLILKLLHKPKNVSEKIHDRLGVKLVTHNRLDALRVLYYLYEYNVITFANLTPGRSRNSLLNLPAYRSLLGDQIFNHRELSPKEREEYFAQLSQKFDRLTTLDQAQVQRERENYNPDSSSDYQSLQFTVHQLVKLENPGFFKTRRMRAQLEKYHLGPDLEGLLQELEGPGAEQEFRLLFPLEVQIIDKDNYFQSIEGTASHDAYKQRQQDRACLRVLAGIFALHPELNPHAPEKGANLSLPGLNF